MEGRLLGNLEFSGFNHFSGYINQVIHIKAPVKFSQRNGNFWRNILTFKHFFTQETIYL